MITKLLIILGLFALATFFAWLEASPYAESGPINKETRTILMIIGGLVLVCLTVMVAFY